MLDTKAYLTPITTDLAEKVSRRRYRKKLLPLGSITYKGQKIDFNRQYLEDLVQSFTDEAYDQVPFVLADKDNAHNELPERFRGELDSLELTDDGLYGIVSTNKDGAKLLEDNPKLGVSARIIEGLGKADGRVFRRAIRHVCGTLDPRVTGLGPWQPVDLSDEAADTIETVDLSAAHFDKENEMPRGIKSTKRKVGNREVDLSALTDEQFTALIDLATAVAEAPADVDDVETDEEGNPIVRNEQGQRIDPETGEVIPEPEGDEGDEGDGEGDGDDEGAEGDEPDNAAVKTKPKGKQKQRVTVETSDLSNVVDDDTRDQVTQMRIDLAAERFTASRKEYLDAGVPPFMLDLAEPILAAPEGAVLDLSNTDDPVNAAEVISKMLDGMKGMVDLTPSIGHQIDLSAESDEEKSTLDQWDKEYGAV